MRVLLLVLLLAGCAQDPGGDRSSVTPSVHGAYTTFGGVGFSH